MGTPAIRTEGLSKRYGSADALLGLDLEVAQGEASLWPSLTGFETIHLLGRVQDRVDTAYRDELIQHRRSATAWPRRAMPGRQCSCRRTS